jgi:serine/threonine protein kinase
VAQADDGAPSRIGRFAIEAEIGRGAMGVVYKARDPILGRPVALKVVRLLFAASEEDRAALEQRFLKEARIVARLSHPGIVVVHDVGRDEATGEPFIALEYLVGRTLSSLLKCDRPLPWQESLRTIAGVAEALEYAHRQGVIHRDVKPANIMVLDSGDPKLMDFGIAKVLVGRDLSSTTRCLGTPLYMSPEQALGEPIDGRADIFALGAVAYALLTGRAAFDAPTVAGIIHRVVRTQPPRPTAIRPDLPPALDYVLARALAKSREDRHPNAGSLAEDIEDVLAGRVPRHRSGWKEPATTEATMRSRHALAPVPEDLPELVLDSPEPPPHSTGAEPLPRTPPTSPPAPTTRMPSPSFSAPPRLLAILGLVLLALGLVAFSTVYWREVLLATWPGSPGTQSSRPSPALEPTRAPSEAPPPKPTAPQPSRPKPPAAPARPAPVATPLASLAFSIEHPLKEGALTVWLDDRLVIEKSLAGRPSRNLLVVTTWKGSLTETVAVSPGRHVLRVEVRWDGKVETADVVGVFRGGQARRLEARLGRLSGKLSLAWR